MGPRLPPPGLAPAHCALSSKSPAEVFIALKRHTKTIWRQVQMT